MNSVYLTELAAFNQLQKIVGGKNSEILQVLFSLWDRAKEPVRDKLPSFARLLCIITPDPSSWDRLINHFKADFLHNFYSDISEDLYKYQLKIIQNGGTDVCDAMEREAANATIDLLLERAEKDSKKKSLSLFLTLTHSSLQMSTYHFIEKEALDQLLKYSWLEKNDAEMLQILWVLWEKADENKQEELPSFAHLYSNMKPGYVARNLALKNFKVKTFQLIISSI